MSKSYFLFFLILCIYSINSQDTKLEGASFTSNDSVGLELSSPSRITKISFSPQRSDRDIYLLGVFQESNDKSFFDAIPLYMIKKTNQLNNIEISCTQSFKFVRYVDPQR